MIAYVLAFAKTENIVFTVLSVVAAIALTVFLIFRTRRERKYVGSKIGEKGILSADAFYKLVSDTANSAGKRTKFTLYQIDIRRYDTLIKTIGDEQYATVVKEQCEALQKLQPWGVYIGMKKQDSIYMLIKGEQGSTESICQLIINNLARNYALTQGMSVDVSLNVAAAPYPESGNTAEDLFKNLDITMVVSCRKGENRYALYSPQFGNAKTDEYLYYQEISEAIKAKEFTLYYQPIVDTNTMEVVSCETLLRWMHRTKGVLPPSSFLYVMEQTGDINWVGQWSFEQLMRQSTVWDNNYEQRFDIAFNLSERQLLNPELADEFRKIAKKEKGNQSKILLEIDDMTLYQTSDIAKKNLDAMFANGFKICLDGFGTTFTSPTMLEDLPINQIKMEKVFWSKLKDSSIVANTIKILLTYAEEKGLKIVAAGVEDAEEMELLRKHGIVYMQGYVFSKPKDAKDFIADVVFTPWADDLKTAQVALPSADSTVEPEAADNASDYESNPEPTNPDEAIQSETADTEDKDGQI